MAPPTFGVELQLGPVFVPVPDTLDFTTVDGRAIAGWPINTGGVAGLAAVMAIPVTDPDHLSVVVRAGGGLVSGGEAGNTFLRAEWRAGGGIQALFPPARRVGVEVTVDYNGAATWGLDQDYRLREHGIGTGLALIGRLGNGVSLLVGGRMIVPLAGEAADDLASPSWQLLIGCRWMPWEQDPTSTDVVTPRGNGPTLARRLGEIQHRIAVIVDVAEDRYAEFIKAQKPTDPFHPEVSSRVQAFAELVRWLVVPGTVLPFSAPAIDAVAAELREVARLAPADSDDARLAAALQTTLDEAVARHVESTLQLLGSATAGLVGELLDQARLLREAITNGSRSASDIGGRLEYLAHRCRQVITDGIVPFRRKVTPMGGDAEVALEAAYGTLGALLWGTSATTVDPGLTIPALRRQWLKMKE